MESATATRGPEAETQAPEDDLGGMGAPDNEPDGAGAGDLGGKHEPPDPPTPPADLPDDGNGEEEEPQLFLIGERELGVKVGGKKPDATVLKLKGGKIDVSGQFDRGTRFLAVMTLQITGDNDQDTIEKLTGAVKSTSKAQSATVCGVTRIEEFVMERLRDSVAFTEEEIQRIFKALELELPEGE